MRVTRLCMRWASSHTGPALVRRWSTKPHPMTSSAMMVPLFLEVPTLALNLASKLVAHGLAHRAPSRAKTLVHVASRRASPALRHCLPVLGGIGLARDRRDCPSGHCDAVRVRHPSTGSHFPRRLNLSPHLCWYICFLVDVLELRWVRFLSW